MTDTEAIKLFKCLADLSRLRILKSLMREEMYVERLAQRLDLAPSTVSFHLKKLEEAGAVTSRREQYYTMYSIRKDIFYTPILFLIAEESDTEQEERRREDAYRQRVLDTFFQYGRLKAIPAQRKKERICLEEIVKQFEPGRPYDEAEVNDILLRYHDDYCTLRRDMISEKLMTREGRIYTRIQ